MKKLNHYLIPYLAALFFMFGGILGSGSLSWYRSLTLPSYHPGEGFVALIWAVIYVCAAWAVMIVWNMPHRDTRFSLTVAGILVSTLLNVLWSVLFFHAHLFLWSTITAVLLGVSVIVLAVLVCPRSKSAALLFVPYIIWVFFAAYLNYATMLLN